MVGRRGGRGVPSICADQFQPVDNFVGILRAGARRLWRTPRTSAVWLLRRQNKNSFKSKGCVNSGGSAAVLRPPGPVQPLWCAAARAMCISGLGRAGKCPSGGKVC